MSMDDTHRELRVFARELEKFNESVRSSVNALQREHDRISGIWNDRFRKEYDRRFDAFKLHMDRYLSQDAKKYERFIKLKGQQIGRYLGHG